jgi:anti-anti-sigma regulatory factor
MLRGSGPIDADIDGLRLDARMLWVEDPPAPSADPFEVVTEVQGGRAVITVQGHIDVATGPRLGAALAAERRPVLLDLRGVSFMVATARARARADGVDLDLITSAAVDRALEIANLREHFACAPPPTRLAG